MKKEFNYLNGKIDISDIYDKLPKSIKELLSEAEQHDLEDKLGSLVCDCDDIEVRTKLLIPDIITKNEWERICQRYLIS